MFNGSGLGYLLVLLLPFALLIFIMVTQRRRTQQVQALQASLAVGDEVVTTSGLYGTIVSIDDAVVTLDTAARRSLLFLLAIVLVLGGLLAGAVYLSDAKTQPKLGLDLEGGTQIILEPKTAAGQSVSTEQLNQARDIIVQRVDAGGVSGAEVTTQGDRNIV